MVNKFYSALGRFVVRFRWLVVIVWVLGTIVAVKSLPTLSSQVNNNNSQFLPASAPSNQAANLAEPLVGSQNQTPVQVVGATTSGQLSAADEAAMAKLAVSLKKVPTVAKVQFLGTSPNSRAVQLLVESSTSPFDQGGVTDLVNNISTVVDHASTPAGFDVNVAGAEAADVANQKQSQKQGNETQLFSIVFIIILLLLIFRSFLAPLVTLIPAAIVLQLAGSLIGGLGSVGLKISGITQLLLIVLILGAGTDYGLFLVFRVREELQRGYEPKEAVARSVTRVGESISASAITVVVALLTLTLASFGIYHDLGAPLAIGIFVMLLAGLTLLPALLAILGRAVFWPARRSVRPLDEPKEGVWGRVAGKLVQRPGWSLAAGLVVFGLLALAALGYKPAGFGGDLAAPAGTSAAAGNAALKANFPQASQNPTNLVFQYGTSVWTDPSVLATASHQLRASGEFNKMSGPLDPNGTALSPQQLETIHAELGPAYLLSPIPTAADLARVPAAQYNAYRATDRYISTNGHVVQFEAGLTAGDPGSTAALNAVPKIRTTVATVAHDTGASANGVAGEAPALYDVSSISGSDLRHIIPIAVLAIALVLALVLRSLIAPLYLIASVVLSYLASLGLAVILFIELGGEGGITFLLPFLMFIFLLALGEDYNILVMTRIREEARKQPLRRAVVRAVGATGPTVTSAGLVLAGTFGVLAVVGGSGQGGSQVQAIGVGLAVGILLDTFVVRTVLVPATVELLGRWNWWPGRMSRIDPGFDPSAAAVAPASSSSASGGVLPADGTGGRGPDGSDRDGHGAAGRGAHVRRKPARTDPARLSEGGEDTDG